MSYCKTRGLAKGGTGLRVQAPAANIRKVVFQSLTALAYMGQLPTHPELFSTDSGD
jgi:hypothetical protein